MTSKTTLVAVDLFQTVSLGPPSIRKRWKKKREVPISNNLQHQLVDKLVPMHLRNLRYTSKSWTYSSNKHCSSNNSSSRWSNTSRCWPRWLLNSSRLCKLRWSRCSNSSSSTKLPWWWSSSISCLTNKTSKPRRRLRRKKNPPSSDPRGRRRWLRNPNSLKLRKVKK